MLENGSRSKQALVITLAEMNIQGVSTRKLNAITNQLCEDKTSAVQVSMVVSQLDALIMEWRERPLEEIIFHYLNSCYQKVMQAG